ncbi:MAG: LacI family DNA-binding transcriptional regulator [Rouxiella badensis]|uniref:LacI family transcriptional regulator n=1 Tax=Rouxiella badensis TaxID=1646377 RepID=A0A1X0WL41_9GAMM|nr:LacI family DNA-binding transcriptional regulator [Rouxiella badensis]ORJ27431.1 LacI family transcriptional regulator [Rouxiella badensis]QII40447.1 LacI family DNA-binding transcriptional regulator [Rouxiella badensis]QOI55771.1 LacI family DNA-binding transcriptional regulator [Rouxiella badensis subsp. acadiensis]
MTKETKAPKPSKATASDVAELAGVSKWTVSRAFTPGASVSDKAQKKVLAAAEILGYRPNLLARSLTKKSTHIIGVAIDELKNPHSMMVLDTVTKALQTRGYMTLLLNITEGENYQAVITMADQLQVDGILFLGNVLTTQLYDVAHAMHHIPLVQVCRNSEEHRGVDIVNIDGYQAGREIAELFLAQGYQRFGYMKGPDVGSNHLLRMEGFRDGLEAKGATLNVMMVAGHYDRNAAYQQITGYWQATPRGERIEAMFCENDILAIGVLEALIARDQRHSMGVIGFDDIDEASSPVWQLTSYRQPREKLIAEALNRLIDDNPDPDGDWRHGELIIRQSHLKR